MSTICNVNVTAVTPAAALLAIGVAMSTPAHAGGFYGPRNTIPFDPPAPVGLTCGAVFAPTWSGPRPPRFVKVKDLGPCPVSTIERWVGPRATIPVYKK